MRNWSGDITRWAEAELVALDNKIAEHAKAKPGALSWRSTKEAWRVEAERLQRERVLSGRLQELLDETRASEQLAA